MESWAGPGNEARDWVCWNVEISETILFVVSLIPRLSPHPNESLGMRLVCYTKQSN